MHSQAIACPQRHSVHTTTDLHTGGCARALAHARADACTHQPAFEHSRAHACAALIERRQQRPVCAEHALNAWLPPSLSRSLALRPALPFSLTSLPPSPLHSHPPPNPLPTPSLPARLPSRPGLHLALSRSTIPSLWLGSSARGYPARPPFDERTISRCARALSSTTSTSPRW